MNHPTNVLFALFELLFPPVMLLVPLLCVAFVRNRDATAAHALEIRGRKVALVVATAFALTLWLGCALQAPRSNIRAFAIVARYSWVMFFPLWFGLAMPIAQLATTQQAAAGLPHGNVRVASLVNRARKHPIARRQWLLAGTLGLLGLAALGSRWFGEPFADERARTAFLWQLAGQAGLLALVALVLPFSLRRMLLEPEPLDAHGNPKLQRMYDDLRTARARSLFWVLGVATPAMFATAFSIVAWTGIGELGGWLGALGGSAIGLCGATIGVISGLRRMRIAAFKQKLDAQGEQGSGANG